MLYIFLSRKKVMTPQLLKIKISQRKKGEKNQKKGSLEFKTNECTSYVLYVQGE